jgi:copper(I)-binding protein
LGGSYHIRNKKAQAAKQAPSLVMRPDPKKPLSRGDHIKATPVFEKAGPVEVELATDGGAAILKM